MDGFLNVLKPPGMTSHDVVNRVRRICDERRVGHTGTLDPDVPGVLAVGIGQAVRLNEYLLDADKAYRAEITFGISTSTGDVSGDVTASEPAGHITGDRLAEAFQAFTGAIEQLPPMISAVKVKGRRLYDIARSGEEVERQLKRVVIHSLVLLEFRPGDRPSALFDVACSKGTYVRTLCEDIGQHLGVPAHMSYLVRTRSGPFGLAGAGTLQDMARDIGAHLLPMTSALPGLPCFVVAPEHAARIPDGVLPDWSWFAAGDPELPQRAGLTDGAGRLLAVVDRDPTGRIPYRYAKVLCHGSDGDGYPASR